MTQHFFCWYCGRSVACPSKIRWTVQKPLNHCMFLSKKNWNLGGRLWRSSCIRWPNWAERQVYNKGMPLRSPTWRGDTLNGKRTHCKISHTNAAHMFTHFLKAIWNTKTIIALSLLPHVIHYGAWKTISSASNASAMFPLSHKVKTWYNGPRPAKGGRTAFQQRIWLVAKHYLS